MDEKKEENKEEIILSEKDKTMLINTINKKCFFLEEKAYGILEQREGLFTLRKNFIPRNYNKHFDERVEIDLVFAQDNKNLIIECKKTDFAWLFPKNNEREFVKTQPRHEDSIQRAVLQVLRQTKAWRWEPESTKPISFFIPVILTNAPLFFLDYGSKQIDENSNLKDYNYLKKVKGIVYNYSEFLDWPNAKDEREIKSVFIINIHHFTEFLDWIMMHNLASLKGLLNIGGSEKYNFS